VGPNRITHPLFGGPIRKTKWQCHKTKAAPGGVGANRKNSKPVRTTGSGTAEESAEAEKKGGEDSKGASRIETGPAGGLTT